MKKGLFLSLMIGLIGVFGISNVKAEVLSWDSITTDYSELIKNDNYTINKTDNSLEVSLVNPKYGNYSIKFKYDDTNKTISYQPTRDLTSINDETKAYYSFSDNYFILYLLTDLLKLYKIDLEKLPEDFDLTNYGVTMDGEDVSFTNTTSEGTTTLSGQYVTNLLIDLKKLDETTSSIQNTVSDYRMYDVTFLVISMIMDPMGNLTNAMAANVSFDLNDTIQVAEEQSQKQESNSNTITKVTEEKTNEKNPKTGLNTYYVYGFISIIVSLIGIIKLNKKNIFSK